MGFEFSDASEETPRTSPGTIKTCTVKVRPKAKARPRMSKQGHVYTDKATKEYEELIRTEWKKQTGNFQFHGAPLEVDLGFLFKRPQSHYKKGSLRSDAPAAFLNVPDLDNVEKAVLDALNKIAYDDDKLIIVKTSSKHWNTEDTVLIRVRAR